MDRTLALFAWFTCSSTLGCDSRTEPKPLGQDCNALVVAATRASRCDPGLARLAARVRADPDERRCAAAARRVLDPPKAPDARLHSVFEARDPPRSEPLALAERERLAASAVPSTLVLAPDLPPVPGITRPRAWLDGHALIDDEDSLRILAAPGEHALQVRHAGRHADYCIALRDCETLRVTLHGVHLARNDDVREGLCRSPGTRRARRQSTGGSFFSP